MPVAAGQDRRNSTTRTTIPVVDLAYVALALAE
jgi:hypothetical protein